MSHAHDTQENVIHKNIPIYGTSWADEYRIETSSPESTHGVPVVHPTQEEYIRGSNLNDNSTENIGEPEKSELQAASSTHLHDSSEFLRTSRLSYHLRQAPSRNDGGHQYVEIEPSYEGCWPS